ncbi:thrombospondin type 3 repeat-containing protein, partial [Patescibacteria group bacterium]|nr:thrombospondin type 3 repeat-containing protein [Patescibacteria group bacterium]
FLLFVVIFIFKSKDKGIKNDQGGNGELENIVNKLPESGNIANILDELKNNHPEFSVSQLEFYFEIAKSDKEIKKQCEGRDGENDCIASVAFIKGESAVCGEIENSKIRIECANAILQKVAAEKIDKCRLFDNDNDFTHCLRNVFVTYDKPEDCLNLESEKTRQACEGIFYYEMAFVQQNGEFCRKIIDEKLNRCCFENVSGKFSDSDNDGLSDIDEVKFKTNPNNPDTDGDGFNDSDEVKNGFNPLGEG